VVLSFGKERLFGWFAVLRGLDIIALRYLNLKLFNTVKHAIRNVSNVQHDPVCVD
jgi:hypothetical protein